MPTRKCLGTNKTTFQSILGVSISVRKYRQKIRNGGTPPLLIKALFFGGASLSPGLLCYNLLSQHWYGGVSLIDELAQCEKGRR